MTTVTATIKEFLKAKDARQVSGEQYLRGLMGEVRGQVVEELSGLRSDTYTARMLKANLSSIERYVGAFESRAGREMNTLLDAAWNGGADLVPAAMRAGGLFAAFGHIPGPLLATLKEFAFHKIAGLSTDAFTKIRGELSLGILGQKTPHQVIQSIAGSLESPGVFKSLEARAETIAKVEMGRAYSSATVESLNQAVQSVPQMQKEWWHAGHPKTPRINHVRLNGQRQPVDKPFHYGGLIIEYPRAPSSPPQETINCGCEVVPWHPDWKQAAPAQKRLAASWGAYGH
ncbi:MAG: phage minor head protein [Desulfobacteraceae bacterium]|nr:phage minor head protein [Desulfobacteraceae bacterium]